MDQIKKFLQKLNHKNKEDLKVILDKITSRDLTFLDVRKIKGRNNYYRVRQRNYRIIFYMDINRVEIVFAGRRDDNTYKGF